MPDPTSARVFVSYSRKDGAAFAADLCEKLRKQDLSVWRDLVALEGGRDWWSQIEGTLALLGSGRALAELILNGAAATTGDITVGARSEIDLTGSNSFTEAGGSTTVAGSLVAATINADGGKLDFKSAITRDDGVGSLNIGSLGTLEFDAAIDRSHAIKFRSKTSGTLALGDGKSFDGSLERSGNTCLLHP